MISTTAKHTIDPFANNISALAFSEMNHGIGDISKSTTDVDAVFGPLSDPLSSSVGMGSSGSQNMMNESISMVVATASLSTTMPVAIGMNETSPHHAGVVGFEDSTNNVGDDEDFGDFEEATYATAPTPGVMGSISIPKTTSDREDEIVHTMEAVVLTDTVSDMISTSSIPIVPAPVPAPVSIEEFTKLNFDSFMVTSNVGVVSMSDDHATSSAISSQPSSPLRPQPSSSFTTDTIGIHDSSLAVPEVQSLSSPMGFNALDQLVLEDMDEPIPLTTDLLATTNPADSSLLGGPFVASFGSSSSMSSTMGLNTMTGLPPFHNTHSNHAMTTTSTTTTPTRISILDLFDTNTASSSSSSSQRDNYSALEVSSNLEDSALHTLAIQLADKKYFDESHCCFQKLAYRQTILALLKETKQENALDMQRRLERQKVSTISF